MPTPWWHPDAVRARLPYLRARQTMISAVRAYFDGQDFFAVETPCLQTSPGLEPHLHAFRTEIQDPLCDQSRALYLHTSPEFAMKKLLVGGLPRLYQIAHVFRNNERSDTHHPEFTMIEWYRAGASYLDLMDDVEGLFLACATSLGLPPPRCQRMTVAAAFTHYAGIDLLSTVPESALTCPPADGLRQEARRIGVYCGENDTWDDVFFHIFLDRIEPHLGQNNAEGTLCPVILYDWPVCMAALSRVKPTDRRLCERFEVYAHGIELANAFGELTDAQEQRRRFEQDMTLKEHLYGLRYPIDEDFIAALDYGLPDCAGIALGLDRLAMILSGAERIDQVLWAEVSPPPASVTKTL